MTNNVESLADFKAQKEAKAKSGQDQAKAHWYAQQIKQVRSEYQKLTGKEYAADGYFVFRYDIYEGWIPDLEAPEDWPVKSIAVHEQGKQFKAVGPAGAGWATEWEPMTV